MASLVALDLPLGPRLEDAVRACASEGDAVTVVDSRWSPRARRAALDALGVTEVWDADGRHRLSDGGTVDDEVGAVVLTSGSSGAPKAAEITWDALRASARLTQATLRDDRPPAWFPCLPAVHIGGLAVILRAVLDDASLVWAPSDRFDLALERGATHVAVVRAHLSRYDLSGFRTVLLGGARPPTDRPANVVTTWGMTETGSGVVYDGRPLPEVEISTSDGELLVRSPTLFRSYRDRPRPSATGPDGRDDWFPTGDAAEIVDGRLHVSGRRAYVINTGGEKVWPDDLEAVLASVGGVRDVAVTAVPDDEWGDRLVALVVTDGRRVDDSLVTVAAEAIGPWAKPKEIRYVTAIPRTGNGKIRRSDLPYLQ